MILGKTESGIISDFVWIPICQFTLVNLTILVSNQHVYVNAVILDAVCSVPCF